LVHQFSSIIRIKIRRPVDVLLAGLFVNFLRHIRFHFDVFMGCRLSVLVFRSIFITTLWKQVNHTDWDREASTKIRIEVVAERIEKLKSKKDNVNLEILN